MMYYSSVVPSNTNFVGLDGGCVEGTNANTIAAIKVSTAQINSIILYPNGADELIKWLSVSKFPRDMITPNNGEAIMTGAFRATPHTARSFAALFILGRVSLAKDKVDDTMVPIPIPKMGAVSINTEKDDETVFAIMNNDEAMHPKMTTYFRLSMQESSTIPAMILEKIPVTKQANAKAAWARSGELIKDSGDPNSS